MLNRYQRSQLVIALCTAAVRRLPALPAYRAADMEGDIAAALDDDSLLGRARGLGITRCDLPSEMFDGVQI
jgi:hypothetical protein